MGEMKDPKKLHFKAIDEQKGVSMILYCLQNSIPSLYYTIVTSRYLKLAELG